MLSLLCAISSPSLYQPMTTTVPVLISHSQLTSLRTSNRRTYSSSQGIAEDIKSGTVGSLELKMNGVINDRVVWSLLIGTHHLQYVITVGKIGLTFGEVDRWYGEDMFGHRAITLLKSRRSVKSQIVRSLRTLVRHLYTVDEDIIRECEMRIET